MTIQFNYPWNGYSGIQTLADAEETRLVGLGVARYYTPYMDGGPSNPEANNLELDPTTGAMQIGGAAPTAAQRASVRAGIGADDFRASSFRIPTIAVTGDSISADAKTGNHFTNWGWVTHFRRMLVGRADIRASNIFAVAGQGVDNLNTVQVPQVVALRPDWCCVAIGTNDVGINDIIAGLTQAYSTLLSAGIKVIAGPILPHAAPSVFSAANKKIVDRVNRWIFETANTTPGMLYADTLRYVTDYSTGNAATGMLRDGIHTTTAGAYNVARGFFDVVDDVMPRMKWVSGVDVGTYDQATNPTGDILANGLMRGAGGTLRNGASGTPPDSWYGQRSSGGFPVTIAFSKEPITGFVGAESAVMTLGGTGDGGGGYVGMETLAFSLPSGVGAGDTLLFRCKVEWANLAGVVGFMAVVRVLDGAASSTSQVQDGAYSNGVGLFTGEAGSYWMEVRIVLPSGVNTPSVRFDVATKTGEAVAGEVRVSFADLRKLA